MSARAKGLQALSEVRVGNARLSNIRPFTLIAGPCIMESEPHLRKMAASLKKICAELNLPLILKCSYDKANRSSARSYRGPGVKEGLRMLAGIKKDFALPILTDVHLPQEAEWAAETADVLQIPAFLCRQTDLLIACARTGKPVNIKKGQFLSPWELKNAIEKIVRAGNRQVLLTERGTFFGYNNLVVDMRGLQVMKKMDVPVVYDATHSVQLPGGRGDSSGGQREYVEPLARAAVGVGISALFMEVHPDPDRALSDGPNSVRLSDLKKILKTLLAIDRVVKNSA